MCHLRDEMDGGLREDLQMCSLANLINIQPRLLGIEYIIQGRKNTKQCQALFLEAS